MTQFSKPIEISELDSGIFVRRLLKVSGNFLKFLGIFTNYSKISKIPVGVGENNFWVTTRITYLGHQVLLLVL